MLTRLSHRIAIVGAGPIGSPLAGHLILAGNKVTVGTRRLTPSLHPTISGKTSTIRSTCALLLFAQPRGSQSLLPTKGVAAKETDHCADYPPNDQSVWDWSPAR
jgi:hypothetical protein